jgi:hypothetical protein
MKEQAPIPVPVWRFTAPANTTVADVPLATGEPAVRVKNANPSRIEAAERPRPRGTRIGAREADPRFTLAGDCRHGEGCGRARHGRGAASGVAADFAKGRRSSRLLGDELAEALPGHRGPRLRLPVPEGASDYRYLRCCRLIGCLEDIEVVLRTEDRVAQCNADPFAPSRREKSDRVN